jgi:flagella basal body P-ring formation protein FlgA
MKNGLVTWQTAIILFFLVSATSLRAAQDDLEIRFKNQATVHGDTIYLEHIASFHPEGDGRIEALRHIAVASAPAPGNEYRFNRRFLNYKVGAAIPDHQEDIVLTAPAMVLVKRTAQYVSADQMAAIFKEHVLDRATWPEEDMIFERINTPDEIALPKGQLHWEVLDRGGNNYLGNIHTMIAFSVDGKQVRKASVSGRVSVTQQVIKSIRKISRGDMVSSGDVALQAENRTKLRDGIFSSLDEVLGKKALRNIPPGQTLTARMIEDPPAVKKGGRVVIVAETESIRMTTIGKALEDGRNGDEISVMNIRSGKEILTRVKGPGIVQVFF